jgi:hypothetical protein
MTLRDYRVDAEALAHEMLTRARLVRLARTALEREASSGNRPELTTDGPRFRHDTQRDRPSGNPRREALLA